MLQGEQVYLRSIEPTDVDVILRWENNQDNWRVSSTLVPFSRKIIEDYVNSAQDLFGVKQARFVICLQENAQPIGTIDLFEFDPYHQRAGVGILVNSTKYRGQGHASEALKLLIEYTRDRLKMHQLFCSIIASNEPSIHLFEKAGFVKTGERKDWLNFGNEWEDELFYQLIF